MHRAPIGCDCTIAHVERCVGIRVEREDANRCARGAGDGRRVDVDLAAFQTATRPVYDSYLKSQGDAWLKLVEAAR